LQQTHIASTAVTTRIASVVVSVRCCGSGLGGPAKFHDMNRFLKGLDGTQRVMDIQQMCTHIIQYSGAMERFHVWMMLAIGLIACCVKLVVVEYISDCGFSALLWWGVGKWDCVFFGTPYYY
jgi:hypothetical protein